MADYIVTVQYAEHLEDWESKEDVIAYMQEKLEQWELNHAMEITAEIDS